MWHRPLTNYVAINRTWNNISCSCEIPFEDHKFIEENKIPLFKPLRCGTGKLLAAHSVFYSAPGMAYVICTSSLSPCRALVACSDAEHDR